VGGTIVEILGEVNKTYDIDTVIARIESDSAPEAATSGEPASAAPAATAAAAADPAPSLSPQTSTLSSLSSDRFYSPLVRKVAEMEGISADELERIPGTGFRGRVSKNDVLHFLQVRGSGAPAKSSSGLIETGLAQRVDPDSVEIDEMDSMRRSIAKHMRESIDTSAHVYSVAEADMTAIMEYLDEHRAAFKKAQGHSLTVTHCISRAVRDTLLEFPLANASLDGDKIIKHKHINIGVAVAVGDGLVVPPVRNAEELSLKEISAATSEIVNKARNRKLKLEDLEGATFSITNFGVFGTLVGYPIINQPNVAILGVGAIKKKAVVMESDKGDEIAIRQMGMFTLGFDHRLIDGAMGSAILERIVEHLENFDFSELES
jgi:2-oxoglutarate dehydrogenase E2 component (dihydrolipoamide succinyltransferase)